MNDPWNQTLHQIRREYEDEIANIIDVYLREAVEAGEVNSELDVHDHLEQTLDSHEYVIYTFKAQLVLLVSPNDEAYLEVCEDASTEQRAFYAMLADALNYLDSFYGGIESFLGESEEDEEDEEEEEDNE